MILLSNLQTFLDDLLIYDKNLNIAKIDPHMANGLQVKGNDKINKICLAVSASIETFKLAVKNNCQALIVHHGLNFPSEPRYDRIFQERFAYLIKNNLSLFGYHFLLDSHPKISHGVEILKLLKTENIRPFMFENEPWGALGKIKPAKLTQLIKIVEPHFSPQMTVYPFGKEHIKTIAVCSGRGVPYPSYMQQLINNKVDLYITGEVSEWVCELFREAQINFIAGGHYHTERFGLLALAKILKEKLPAEVKFIELVNKV